MITKVIFAGKYTAETVGPFNDWAVISIGEPDASTPNIKEGWHDVLSLSFHDVDPDSRLESSRGYQPMATTDADKIVEFVEQVAPNVDVILVHCKAGISRSAAVAMWIAARYELPFDHSYPHINDYVMRLLKEADRDEKIEYSETDLSIKKRESQERFVAQVKAGTSKPSDASRLKMATTFMRKTPILRSRFTVIL